MQCWEHCVRPPRQLQAEVYRYAVACEAGSFAVAALPLLKLGKKDNQEP